MNRKIVLKSIIVMIILSLVIPVIGLAEVKESTKKFTLEELTTLALKNSSVLKSAEFSKEATYDTLDNVGGMTSFIPAAGLALNNATAVNTYKLYRNYDIAYDLSQKKLEVEKDKVRSNVLSDFYSITNLEHELDYSKKNLEYQKNMMDIAKLKYNMGLISEIERDSSERQYFLAKDSYELLLAEYSKAYKNLNSLIGLNEDTRYDLVYEDIANIDEDLTEDDGNYFANKNISSSILLEMSEKNLEMNKLNIDYYVYNDPTNYKTKDATELEYQAQVSTFATTKDGINKFTRETFYSAQEMQDNYKKLLVKDKTERELHQIKSIQYDMGMITGIELMESELTLLDNQAKIAALKAGFNQTLFILNNPHVQLS